MSLINFLRPEAVSFSAAKPALPAAAIPFPAVIPALASKLPPPDNKAGPTIPATSPNKAAPSFLFLLSLSAFLKSGPRAA